MGVLFGGTIGLSAVVGGTVAMLTGNELSLTGAGVAFSGLASLVAVFFAGRKKQTPPSDANSSNKPRPRRTT
jgi:hypothetical protein